MSSTLPDSALLEPLRIAIVSGSVSRRAGGLFTSVRRSALGLQALGHQVDVLGLADADSEEDRAAWAPLTVMAAPRMGPAAIGYAPAISRALAAGRYDVVHLHGLWQAFSAQVSSWRRRSGGPVMISPRGMLDPWALDNSAWKKRLTGILYERANLTAARCLHALNPAEAAAMRRFGLTNPIALIPNGADLPQSREIAQPGWWPQGNKVLLFIGRIHPKKGVVELAEGFARFATSDAGAGWHCIIAGWDDGGHLRDLRTTVHRLGMADRIHLPGPLHGADKEAALSHADAFVLPSYSEGLPMSVLEAWAWRLPVLMTAACNLPEGFVMNAAIEIGTEPTLLAQVLAQRLGDDAALAQMGDAGRTLVEQRFTWPRIAADHAAVYRWMCGQSQDIPACVVFNEGGPNR